MASKVAKRRGRLREDRISQMPDDILVPILSLLDDTFSAVQTTVLSKRWNNLWVPISRIRCFRRCPPGYYENQRDDRLMTFVDRVVSLHDSSDIREFEFVYDNRDWERAPMIADDYARIHRCISTVVEHNVVELYLTISNRFDAEPEAPFLLPESLFMCKPLAVLKLVFIRSMSFSNCPTEECFPSLKVLDIRVDDTDPHHPNFVQNLFTCCPVLEDLRIDAILRDYNISISAPELKTLRISMSSFDVIFFINAPKLEKLVL
ncbi:FBD-associated F-box protein At4g10400-like [Argentina anserina]|uniref:FBD-associated F-box protein At4g10400-like n=1 Tax=Argentina anserina TaxID=57926 RepID=UPI0021766AF0|nr:FBD-associated F-box protein At4g10400-like [Potentilla anserina]